MRAVKSGTLCARCTTSLLPAASTPVTACRYRAPGEFIAGARTRLNART